MTREEILSHVDHTLLKPEATWPQIQVICDEAIANHTASVCINTCYVKQAVEYMAGRIPVCCVVGFPLGAMDTASKASSKLPNIPHSHNHSRSESSSDHLKSHPDKKHNS